MCSLWVHRRQSGCLLFRDRLPVDPDERALYEETKRRLAAQSWRRVQDYADAKSEVVEGIIARGTRGGPHRARAARATKEESVHEPPFDRRRDQAGHRHPSRRPWSTGGDMQRLSDGIRG